MVDAAGQRWPEGSVKGAGSSARGIRPIRYLGQLQVLALAGTRIRGSMVFTKSVAAIHEPDINPTSSSG
jgi:hypothetical protein